MDWRSLAGARHQPNEDTPDDEGRPAGAAVGEIEGRVDHHEVKSRRAGREDPSNQFASAVEYCTMLSL